MELSVFLIFLFTTAVVVFSPGAAAIAVASQGASAGGRRALAGVLGVASANVVYFVLSATGIASLIIASQFIFNIIKWVGVAYLLYLGFTAAFSKAGVINIEVDRKPRSLRLMFAQGLTIEFANPKALLYFASILPQFVNPEANVITQLVIMGLATVSMDLISYSLYAFLGHKIARGGLKPWVVGVINKSAGGALIFAGVKMASV